MPRSPTLKLSSREGPHDVYVCAWDHEPMHVHLSPGMWVALVVGTLALVALVAEPTWLTPQFLAGELIGLAVARLLP